MTNKIAAHFNKPRITTYTYERLSYCRGCQSFTSLHTDSCPSCGKSHTLIPVSSLKSWKYPLRFMLELLVLVGGAFLAAMLADTQLQLYVSAICGFVIVIGYLILYWIYTPSLKKYRQYQILVNKIPDMEKGLAYDESLAEQDYAEGRYKECYEKLREIGFFLWNDRIRNNKLICLNLFVLRKDMMLELETLVPSRYSEPFNYYLWNVSKVGPALIRRRTLSYVLRYRSQLERLFFGRELLINVASASLRIRENISICQYLIADYAEYLPPDRFRRLCHLLATSSPDNCPELYARAKEIARARYPNKPLL